MEAGKRYRDATYRIAILRHAAKASVREEGCSPAWARSREGGRTAGCSTIKNGALPLLNTPLRS